MDPNLVGQSPFDQCSFDVRFDWGLEGLMRFGPKAKVVVIVDVLSFTTCVDVATSRSAVVLPYPGDEDGLAEHAAAHNAVAATRRRGDTTAWTLSPASLLTIPTGTRLVLPSPNGSLLSFKAAEFEVVVLARCLRNASAVAAAAVDVGPPIAVVAAGERWEHSEGQLRVAVEDLIGAGAIITGLPGLELSAEAHAAWSSFNSAGPVHDLLRSSGSSRELIERGFADDIEIAAAHDSSSNPFHPRRWSVRRPTRTNADHLIERGRSSAASTQIRHFHAPWSWR